MLRKLLKSIACLCQHLVKQLYQKGNRYIHMRPKMIKDYREFCVLSPQHRALVSYLVAPLSIQAKKRDRVIFSNFGIAQYIPRALNELDYRVDIINYDQLNWRLTSKYDLFIGHGGINYEHISINLSESTTQIYFSTGIYWREFNYREAERILNLTRRSGYLIQPDRSIRYSEEYANQVADGIICLGNENAVKSYDKFSKVIGINNAVFPVSWNKKNDEDYKTGRKDFLFFSGGGNLHKGLDLLIEAFAGSPLHLHICQEVSQPFYKIYKNELTNLPNIHVYGSIPMRSTLFHQLVQKCNWVISATCAEGQPGAVLECMGYGLIPILTEAANINLDDFGVLIPGPDIKEIRSIVSTCSEMSVSECKRRSEKVRKVIAKDYSPEIFLFNFKKAVQEIVKAKSCNS